MACDGSYGILATQGQPHNQGLGAPYVWESTSSGPVFQNLRTSMHQRTSAQVALDQPMIGSISILTNFLDWRKK